MQSFLDSEPGEYNVTHPAFKDSSVIVPDREYTRSNDDISFHDSELELGGKEPDTDSPSVEVKFA